MGYGFIVTVLSIALTCTYVFVSEASIWAKALVAGLMIVSFWWQYGFFLRVFIGIVLALYFAYLKVRSE